ncbi:MAG: hypothetical protein ACI8PV_001724, partial [Dinoroseobacter sp.]
SYGDRILPHSSHWISVVQLIRTTRSLFVASSVRPLEKR